ncbi:class I SAM-dependent methyltransferase [Clostridium luticellarii]|jgi:tRNA (cmo5U34)-methyltransferase|uniref:class I SAM-dependent methyltransferase n=1 Tax=Clostridium luticellarii TaxID=1691940 RepID=UPI0023564C34|nr:class I SAM-dependent methyltransferase [Clostridium luticellarii]MCI1946157.1 class I SAM-dependent methyltransferase [Clostridium luticellarii]MCI1969240.1 class I SAM-dependent methyltransferase [Clostridium luticellarii]MCI2040873.1 class I SAM-dependent methyltransferase [Clostridium luticellarii]
MELEEMGSFFNERVDGYEQHMLNNVAGSDKYYIETAKLIPKITGLKILDLGCGTGLELDEIFKINPTVQVTGIDLAKDMMKKIQQKHSDKLAQINLIENNYFDYDMGENVFDVVLSVQTLHHFTHEEKIKLYNKILKSLKQNGFYIETDYMAPNQEYEDQCFAENKKIRSKLGITEGFYHYDTPCTVENEIKMLLKAGFESIKNIGKYGNTGILLAKK